MEAEVVKVLILGLPSSISLSALGFQSRVGVFKGIQINIYGEMAINDRIFRVFKKD